MQPQKREKIDHFLRSLAQSHSATMELMEQTLALLCEELSLDPFTYFKTHPTSQGARTGQPGFTIDPTLLSITFRGKTCFLGNTLPLKLLSYSA